MVTFTDEVLNGKFHFLYIHKVRKMVDPDFLKKIQMGQEGPIKSKNWPKNEVLGGFDKNLIYYSYVLFYFLIVLGLWPKNLWTTQNAGFFKMQYLTK